MVRKIFLWGGVVILILLAAGAVYLLTQPDPGPYIVALRSDTPDQVKRALDAILAADSAIAYDGRTYPPVATDDLQKLGWRYYYKSTGQTREPLKGDTATWMGFANRVADKIRSSPGR